MLQPDFKEFSRLAREATLVPVVKSVSADLLTPVSAFLAIAEKQSHAFLLESIERGEQIGRYRLYCAVSSGELKLRLFFFRRSRIRGSGLAVPRYVVFGLILCGMIQNNGDQGFGFELSGRGE